MHHCATLEFDLPLCFWIIHLLGSSCNFSWLVFILHTLHNSFINTFFDIASDSLFSGYLEVIWYDTPHVSAKADSDFVHWNKRLLVPKTDSSLFADYYSHSNTFSILIWFPILQEVYVYLIPLRLFNKFRFQKWTTL